LIRSLAWRSVTARKLRAALNGAGIVLGVALIFGVISLSNTIVSTFDDLISSVYGSTDVIVSGKDSQGTVDEPVLEKVKKVNGVENATGTVQATMTLIGKDGKAGTKQTDQINTAGIVPSDPDLTGSKLIAGRGVQSGNELEIDESFAAANGLSPGETIKVATPTGVKEFKVVGTRRFGDGLDFGGQGFAAIPQATARDAFDIKKGYSEITVQTTNSADTGAVKKNIKKLAGDGIEVNTPNERSDEINQQLQSFSVFLYFFAGMALFAGAYLILNSFNMTVAQRLREIGMLRTLGGSRRQITRMILIEALFLGILGSLFGVLIGLGLSQLLAEMVKGFGFPLGSIKYPVAAFIAAPIVGLIATIVGALRPAIKAGRIPPIQAVLSQHNVQPLRLGRRIVTGTVMILLGLTGVFILASSSSTPPGVALAGMLGVIFLFTGVIRIGPAIVPPLVRLLAWPLRKFAPIEARLSADSAKANPVRTASTSSGLMIGIALVAAIGTLGSSFIGSMSDDLDKELKNDFTVQPRNFSPGAGPQQTISKRAVNEIARLPGAKTTSGNRVLWVTGGFEGSDYQAYGLDPKTHLQFTTPDYKGGTPEAVNQKLANGQVTILEQLAKAKKVGVGDTIKLKGAGGSGAFKIAATTTSNSLEGQSIAMSNENFERIFGIPGYSQIQVLAASSEARAGLEKQINGLLGKQYPTFEVLSNEQIKQLIKDQINRFFSLFYVIMMIAIIVSLLGVVNTLLMNVLERTREIGVLRAIGSSRWQVRRLIVQESLLLTSAGAVMGLAVGMSLGYAFVKGISSQSINATFHPPLAVIFGVAFLAILFGLIAAVLPARRAAKMNIIEAVSYE
jgi:putative ABC transport system permease protein